MVLETSLSAQDSGLSALLWMLPVDVIFNFTSSPLQTTPSTQTTHPLLGNHSSSFTCLPAISYRLRSSVKGDGFDRKHLAVYLHHYVEKHAVRDITTTDVQSMEAGTDCGKSQSQGWKVDSHVIRDLKLAQQPRRIQCHR
jgi:hypothetical protein